MNDLIKESIGNLHTEFNRKFEQALIDACMKKGLVLNVASAPDFMTVEHDGWKTLIHMPTNTKICRYSTEPSISNGYDDRDDKWTVRGEIEFQEL